MKNIFSKKLSNIGDDLKNLIYEIRDVRDSIGVLSYVTETSNRQLIEQLSQINSSIGGNNLLTGIRPIRFIKSTKKLRV